MRGNQQVIAEPKLISSKYPFKVKFGDKDRSFDGLVAYFNAKKSALGEDPPAVGDELDLSELYTYFVKENGKDKKYLRCIRSENYPKFQPIYVDPVDYLNVLESLTALIQYEARKFSDFRMFGAIVDPFVAMHGYTSILPNQPLKLLTWTWETAFKKMRTFFCWGPMLVTD